MQDQQKVIYVDQDTKVRFVDQVDIVTQLRRWGQGRIAPPHPEMLVMAEGARRMHTEAANEIERLRYMIQALQGCTDDPPEDTSHT